MDTVDTPPAHPTGASAYPPAEGRLTSFSSPHSSPPAPPSGISEDSAQNFPGIPPRKKPFSFMKIAALFLMPLVGIVVGLYLTSINQDIRQQANQEYESAVAGSASGLCSTLQCPAGQTSEPVPGVQGVCTCKNTALFATNQQAEEKKPDGQTCNNSDDCLSGNCQAGPGGKYCLAAGTTLSSTVPENGTCGTTAFNRECQGGLTCRNNRCVKISELETVSTGSCLGDGETCEGGRGYVDTSCGGRNIRCGTAPARTSTPSPTPTPPLSQITGLIPPESTQTSPPPTVGAGIGVPILDTIITPIYNLIAGQNGSAPQTTPSPAATQTTAPPSSSSNQPVASGRCLAPGESCAAGSHFDAFCAVTETRCGAGSAAQTRTQTSSPPPAATSLAMVPTAPTSQREALDGPLTCAGNVQGGQVVLGPANRIYECNGQTGLMVDRTKDGYTFADLTVKPASISATDLTASLVTLNALTAGQTSSGRSCGGSGNTAIASGNVAIGTSNQRMRCQDGKWESCPSCALTVIPQYLYSDPTFQQELEERKLAQENAQNQYSQSFAECRAAGKTDDECNTKALATLENQKIASDIIDSIKGNFELEQTLANEYFPQLEKYNVCLAQNNNNYEVCATYAHQLNKTFAQNGMPPSYKQYFDTEGYVSYVVQKQNDLFSEAKSEYSRCLAQQQLGEKNSCTDTSATALAHPNLSDTDKKQIEGRFVYFQSNIDICKGIPNCNPDTQRRLLLAEAGFGAEEQTQLKTQYQAYITSLAVEGGEMLPQTCSLLATSPADAERCYSDMDFMRRTILANVSSAARGTVGTSISSFQTNLLALQALQTGENKSVLDSCRSMVGGAFQFRATRERCGDVSTAQWSILNSLPDSLKPAYTTITSANGKEAPLLVHQAACNNQGQCVAAATTAAGGVRAETVGLNSPYAFSCPTSCAVVGAGSGTSTTNVSNPALPYAAGTEATSQCSPDGRSVEVIRTQTTGSLTLPSSKTTRACPSGICSAGNCVDGAIRTVVLDQTQNIYGQKICEVGKKCEVVDPLGNAYTTVVTQKIVDGEIIFQDQIQGTPQQLEAYNRQVRNFVIQNPDITNTQFIYDLTEFQITNPGSSYSDFLAYKQREALDVIKKSEGHMLSWLTGQPETEKIFNQLVSTDPTWFVQGVVSGRLNADDFTNKIQQIGQTQTVCPNAPSTAGLPWSNSLVEQNRAQDCAARQAHNQEVQQNALQLLVTTYNDSLSAEARESQFAKIRSELITDGLETYRLGVTPTQTDIIEYQTRQLQAAAFMNGKMHPNLFTENELNDPTILARISRNPTLNSLYENYYVNDVSAQNLVNALQGNFDYVALQNRYENDSSLRTATWWNNTLSGSLVRGYLAIEEGGDEWRDGNYFEGAYDIARGNVMIAAKPVGTVAAAGVVAFNCVTNACLGNIPFLAATGGQALAVYGTASAVGDVATACDLTAGSGTNCAKAGVNLAINAAFLRTASIGVASLGKTGTALSDDAFNVAEKMVSQQQAQNSVRTTLGQMADTAAINTTRYVAPVWFAGQGIDCFQQEGTNKLDCSLMIAQAGVTALTWHPKFQSAVGAARQNVADLTVNSAQAAVACSIGLKSGDTAACTQALAGAVVSGGQIAAGHGAADPALRFSENGESLSALGELQLARQRVAGLYGPDGQPLENAPAVRAEADELLRRAIHNYAVEEMQFRLALQTVEGDQTIWTASQKNLSAAQKLFLDSQQAYNRIATDNTPISDIINSPEFAAYNAARNTLSEVFQSSVREQAALAPPKITKVDAETQRSFDEARANFEHIAKQLSPEHPLYEDAFARLIQAKNSVETAHLNITQKSIQDTILAKQTEQAALQEQALLTRKEIELAKNRDAALAYTEEISARQSLANQHRNSLGDGPVVWDAASGNWRAGGGRIITDLVGGKYVFDAAQNVWHSADNALVDSVTVTAEQNRLIESARQLGDQNITKLGELAARSQEILGIAQAGGNEVLQFANLRNQNIDTLRGRLTEIQQETATLSDAMAHSETFIGRLQETLGRIPTAEDILAQARQPDAPQRTLEAAIADNARQAFQRVLDAPRELFRNIERSLTARRTADFTHFTEIWSAQKAADGNGPVRILSGAQQTDRTFIVAEQGADATTRNAVNKMNEIVADFVSETGMTPSPDQIRRIVDGLATGNYSEILAMGAGGGKTSVIQRFLASANAKNGKISLHYMPSTGALDDFIGWMSRSGNLFEGVPILKYDSQTGWSDVLTGDAVSPAEVQRLADRATQRGEGFVALTDVDSAAWGRLQAQVNVEHAAVFSDLFTGAYTKIYTDEIQTFSSKNWSVTVDPPQPIGQINDSAAFGGLTGRGPNQTVGMRAIELTEQVLAGETVQRFKESYDSLVRKMEDVSQLFRENGAEPIPADPQLVRDSYRELVEQQLRELPEVPETTVAREALNRLLEISSSNPETFIQEFNDLRTAAAGQSDPELSRAIADLGVREYALHRLWDVHMLVPDTAFGVSADGQHIALRQRGAETGEMFQDAIGRVVLQLEGPRMLAAVQGGDASLNNGSLARPSELLISGRSKQMSAVELVGDVTTVATTATPGMAQQSLNMRVTGTIPDRPADPSRLIVGTNSREVIADGMRGLSLEVKNGKALFVTNADTHISYESGLRETIVQKNQAAGDSAPHLKIAAVVDADGFRIIELGPNGEFLNTTRFTDSPSETIPAIERWQRAFAKYETRTGADGRQYDLPLSFQHNGESLSPAEVLIFSNRVEQVDITPMPDIYAVNINSNKNTLDTLQQQVARNRAWARFQSDETVQTQLRNRGYTEAEIVALSETRQYEMWLRSSDPDDVFLANSGALTPDTVIDQMFVTYQNEAVRQEITRNNMARANQLTKNAIGEIENIIAREVPASQREAALAYARQQVAEIERTAQIQLRRINENPQHGADAVYYTVADGYTRLQNLIAEVSNQFNIPADSLQTALNADPLMSLNDFRAGLRIPADQKPAIDSSVRTVSHNQFLERLAATQTENDFSARFYGGANSQDNRVIASWNEAIETVRAQAARANSQEDVSVTARQTFITRTAEQMGRAFRPVVDFGVSLAKVPGTLIRGIQDLFTAEDSAPETEQAAPQSAAQIAQNAAARFAFFSPIVRTASTSTFQEIALYIPFTQKGRAYATLEKNYERAAGGTLRIENLPEVTEALEILTGSVDNPVAQQALSALQTLNGKNAPIIDAQFTEAGTDSAPQSQPAAEVLALPETTSPEQAQEIQETQGTPETVAEVEETEAPQTLIAAAPEEQAAPVVEEQQTPEETADTAPEEQAETQTEQSESEQAVQEEEAGQESEPVAEVLPAEEEAQPESEDTEVPEENQDTPAISQDAQQALENSSLYISPESAQEIFDYFQTLDDSQKVPLSGGVTTNSWRFEFNGEKYVVKIPYHHSQEYADRVTKSQTRMAERGLAENVAPTTFVSDGRNLIGVQKFVQGEYFMSLRPLQPLKDAGLFITDALNNFVITPSGPVIIDAEYIGLISDIESELQTDNEQVLRAIQNIYGWWLRPTRVNVSQPENLEIDAVLKPEYEAVLAQIQTDRVPESWLKQARLAAHMLQALDEGVPLKTRDGQDLQVNLNRFAQNLSASGWAQLGRRRASAVAPLSQSFLARIGRSLGLGEKGQRYVLAELPEWVIDLQNARREETGSFSKEELAFVKEYITEYFETYGEYYRGDNGQNYYDFNKMPGSAQGGSGGGSESPHNYKMYIDNRPSLLNRDGVEEFLSLLRQAGIHPTTMKMLDDDGHNVVLYWQRNLTQEELQTIYKALSQSEIEARGPAQDVPTIELTSDGAQYDMQDTNDSGLGRNGFWNEPTYSSAEFLRQWLALTFKIQKNPSDPYFLSFIRANIADETTIENLLSSAESLDTAGLPLVIATDRTERDLFADSDAQFRVIEAASLNTSEEEVSSEISSDAAVSEEALDQAAIAEQIARDEQAAVDQAAADQEETLVEDAENAGIVTAHSVEMPVGTIQEGVAGLLHRVLGNPVAEAPAKLIFFNTEYEKIGEPMALESASDTAYVLNAGGTVDTTLLTEGSTRFASAQTRAEIEQILATLEIDDQILLETDEAAVVFLKTNDGFFHQYKAPQPIVIADGVVLEADALQPSIEELQAGQIQADESVVPAARSLIVANTNRVLAMPMSYYQEVIARQLAEARLRVPAGLDVIQPLEEQLETYHAALIQAFNSIERQADLRRFLEQVGLPNLFTTPQLPAGKVTTSNTGESIIPPVSFNAEAYAAWTQGLVDRVLAQNSFKAIYVEETGESETPEGFIEDTPLDQSGQVVGLDEPVATVIARDIVNNPNYSQMMREAIEWAQATDEEDLGEYIYTTFYSAGEISEKTQFFYESLTKQQINNLVRIVKRIAGLQNMSDKNIKKSFDYWYQVEFGDGIDTIEEDASQGPEHVGRIYLNTNYEYTVHVFQEIAKRLKSANLPSTMKMINVFREGPIDVEMVERPEKIVVYFAAKDQEKILQILEEVYKDSPALYSELVKLGFTPKDQSAFRRSLSKFAAQLHDSNGSPMIGIAFVQNRASQESFGMMVSSVFAEMHADGIDITDPAATMQHLEAYLEKYRRDPEMPFVAQGGRDLFAPMIARSTAQPVVLRAESTSTPPLALGRPVSREIIGRSAENGGLSEKSISRQHAVLFRDEKGNVVAITDHESTNGTFVDGKAVRAGEQKSLWDGKMVSLGDVNFTLSRDAEGVLQLYLNDTIIQGKPMTQKDALPAESVPWEVTIGRSDTAGILLEDSRVSRSHAQISQTDDGQYFLTDLGSSNGTVLNGAKLPAGRQTLLNTGDVLKFGNTEFTFRIAQDGGIFLLETEGDLTIGISIDGQVDQVQSEPSVPETPAENQQQQEEQQSDQDPIAQGEQSQSDGAVIIGRGQIIPGHTKNHPKGQDVARTKGRSAVIADGVTGGRAENGIRDGAVIAANRLLAALEHARTLPTVKEAQAYLERAINTDIQQELMQKAEELKRTQPGKQLSTTLLGTTVHESGQLLIARVGDPEIYLLRNGNIQELDPVIMLKDAVHKNLQENQIQAYSSTAPNQLGYSKSFWGAKISSFAIRPGDRILLTSDGFGKYFGKDMNTKLASLQAILNGSQTPTEAEQRLINVVNQRQEQFEKQGDLPKDKKVDDISVATLFIGDEPIQAEGAQRSWFQRVRDRLFDQNLYFIPPAMQRLLDINNESNPELESTQQSANYPGVIEGNFWLTRLGWGVQKLPKGQVIKRGDDFYRVVTEENGKKQLASVLPFKQSLPSYQQTVSSIATPEKPHKITLGNNLAAELYKDQEDVNITHIRIPKTGQTQVLDQEGVWFDNGLYVRLDADNRIDITWYPTEIALDSGQVLSVENGALVFENRGLSEYYDYTGDFQINDQFFGSTPMEAGEKHSVRPLDRIITDSGKRLKIVLLDTGLYELENIDSTNSNISSQEITEIAEWYKQIVNSEEVRADFLAYINTSLNLGLSADSIRQTASDIEEFKTVVGRALEYPLHERTRYDENGQRVTYQEYTFFPDSHIAPRISTNPSQTQIPDTKYSFLLFNFFMETDPAFVQKIENMQTQQVELFLDRVRFSANKLRFDLTRENEYETLGTIAYLKNLEELIALYQAYLDLPEAEFLEKVASTLSLFEEDFRLRIQESIDTYKNFTPFDQTTYQEGFDFPYHQQTESPFLLKHISQNMRDLLAQKFFNQITNEEGIDAFQIHQQKFPQFWNDYFATMGIDRPSWFVPHIYEEKENYNYQWQHLWNENVTANAAGYFFLRHTLASHSTIDRAERVLHHEAQHKTFLPPGAPRESKEGFYHEEIVTELIAQMALAGKIELPEVDAGDSGYQLGVNELIRIFREIDAATEAGRSLELLLTGIVNFGEGEVDHPLVYVYQAYSVYLQKSDFYERLEPFTDDVLRGDKGTLPESSFFVGSLQSTQEQSTPETSNFAASFLQTLRNFFADLLSGGVSQN